MDWNTLALWLVEKTRGVFIVLPSQNAVTQRGRAKRANLIRFQLLQGTPDFWGGKPWELPSENDRFPISISYFTLGYQNVFWDSNQMFSVHLS